MAQSARVDVDAEHMLKAGKAIRKAEISYYITESEEALSLRDEQRKQMIEIFSPLIK